MGEIESFGGSSNAANETALEAVADLLRKLQPDSMIQKFVLLVETIDNDDRWMSAFCAPGQKRWDTMGLLEYARTMERNTWLREDREGDDG